MYPNTYGEPTSVMVHAMCNKLVWAHIAHIQCTIYFVGSSHIPYQSNYSGPLAVPVILIILHEPMPYLNTNALCRPITGHMQYALQLVSPWVMLSYYNAILLAEPTSKQMQYTMYLVSPLFRFPDSKSI